MRLQRIAVSVIVPVALVTLVGTSSPAFAAPPPNDTFPGRVAIGTIPFNVTQDTSEATTDADDVELNVCGAPAMDASVWYEYTATADGGLVADVSASNYGAGVFVATGSPGSFEVVACGPGATAWDTTAGETYSIIVIDDQLDGTGNGGTMELVVEVAPPAPSMDVTVNPRASFTRDGNALLSGTVTCSSEAPLEFAFVESELTQQVGRLKIVGFGGFEATCDGATRPWTMEVSGFNGTFRGGKAASVTFGVACGEFQCGVDFEEHVVQLSGGKK